MYSDSENSRWFDSITRKLATFRRLPRPGGPPRADSRYFGALGPEQAPPLFLMGGFPGPSGAPRRRFDGRSLSDQNILRWVPGSTGIWRGAPHPNGSARNYHPQESMLIDWLCPEKPGPARPKNLGYIEAIPRVGPSRTRSRVYWLIPPDGNPRSHAPAEGLRGCGRRRLPPSSQRERVGGGGTPIQWVLDARNSGYDQLGPTATICNLNYQGAVGSLERRPRLEALGRPPRSLGGFEGARRG